MVRKIFAILLFFFTLLAFTSCTSNFYLEGSKMIEHGVPGTYIAKYRAPICYEVGKKNKGPKATYYLVEREGKLFLIELDDSGTGVEIFNHWFGEDGYDHFLTRVKTNMAWHYMVSTDRKLASRIVYKRGDYSLIKKRGIIEVDGKPFAVCPLLRVGN